MNCFDAKYFSDYSFRKALLYAILVTYVIVMSLVFLLHVLIPLPDCDIEYRVAMPNPLYNENPCRHQRYTRLLFLTPDECSYGCRLIVSVILGSIVGWERREADRPAGIRTMVRRVLEQQFTSLRNGRTLTLWFCFAFCFFCSFYFSP